MRLGGGSPNLYLYALDRPTNLVDEQGRTALASAIFITAFSGSYR
jgi:hypothetical protein